MSQILLAQRAYAAALPTSPAIAGAARIARDKSRDAARARPEAIGLAKPSEQPFAQLLAGIIARRQR